MSHDNMSLLDTLKAVIAEEGRAKKYTNDSLEAFIERSDNFMQDAVVTIQEDLVTVEIDQSTFQINLTSEVATLKVGNEPYKQLFCPAIDYAIRRLKKELKNTDSLISGMALHAFEAHS